MDFIGEIGAKLTQTGQKTKKMASNLVDSAKLNTQIAELNKNLQDAYQALGKQYFEIYGENPQEELLSACRQIKGMLTTMEQSRRELNQLRNVLACPSCGHENVAGAKFCAQCSAQLPQHSLQQEPENIFCPSCGNKLASGAHFCTKCGTKLD